MDTDECPRCERHYKIFKADWPSRVPTEGTLARKAGVKRKTSAEMISDHLASAASPARNGKERSLTPTDHKASSTLNRRRRPSRARPLQALRQPTRAARHRPPLLPSLPSTRRQKLQLLPISVYLHTDSKSSIVLQRSTKIRWSNKNARMRPVSLVPFPHQRRRKQAPPLFRSSHFPAGRHVWP